MKYTKKLACLLLALVMVFALATTAFAASGRTKDTLGTITIYNANTGEVYSIYKILDLESYNTDAGAYAYTVTSEWEDWLRSQTEYFSVDDQGYVTMVEGASKEGLTRSAQAYVKSSGISAVATKETPELADSDEVWRVTFDKLDLGYYLVISSWGDLVGLVTTAPNATIEAKSETPSVTKKVQEDSEVGTDTEWGMVNDADIGQTINYKITICLYPGSTNVVLHDQIDTGLYINYNSVSVAAKLENGNSVSLYPGNDYSLETPGKEEGGSACNFEIYFGDDYLDSIEEKTEVVVTYSATLTADAFLDTLGNRNMAYLTFGDVGETPPSTTITYTWSLDVLKYTGTVEGEQPLEGATFILSKNGNIGGGLPDPLKFVKISDNSYRLATDDDNESDCITQITTDETGKFTISGLNADTYYLTEVNAPAGYRTLDSDVKVELIAEEESDGTLTLRVKKDDVLIDGTEVKIENKSGGSKLPETGGIGTTIFYVVGIVLVLGAAVLLITRKRMTNVQ